MTTPDHDPLRILRDCIRQLRAVGTHGAQSITVMRDAGHEALVVLIECEMKRLIFAKLDRCGPPAISESVLRSTRHSPMEKEIDKAMKRATEEDHEDA